MSERLNQTEVRIARTIIYNFILFGIILLWFFYSTVDDIKLLFSICFSIILLIIFSFNYNCRINNKLSVKLFHVFLLSIPLYFLIEIIYFYKPFNPPLILSFQELFGFKLKFDFFLFFFYLSLTILKLLPIKLFYKKIDRMFKVERLDSYIDYFVGDFNYKKITLLILLVPLAAFIEEFVFRSLLLTVMVNYLNWNIIIAIIFISLVFGYSHYSSSKNWVHFLSTSLSSIIYCFALLQLGLLYPWLLHLITNSLALVFFYQNTKKNLMK